MADSKRSSNAALSNAISLAWDSPVARRPALLERERKRAERLGFKQAELLAAGMLFAEFLRIGDLRALRAVVLRITGLEPVVLPRMWRRQNVQDLGSRLRGLEANRTLVLEALGTHRLRTRQLRIKKLRAVHRGAVASRSGMAASFSEALLCDEFLHAREWRLFAVFGKKLVRKAPARWLTFELGRPQKR